MGCDIHLCVERQITDSDHWLTVAMCPFFNRNYRLFALMAGVRNSFDITPIAEQRGIPNNVCHSTRKFYEDNDPGWHSESWLTTAEFRQVIAQLPDEWKDSDPLALLAMMDVYEHKGVAARIVFWFDS